MELNKSTFVGRLKRIRELNGKNPNFVNLNLYKILLREETLLMSYARIKKTQGDCIPISGEAPLLCGEIKECEIEDFKKEDVRVSLSAKIKIAQLRGSLANESWKPLAAKRALMPKQGKVDNRLLSLQGLEERLVQGAMLLIFEAIYEPTFSDFSSGFCPNKGVHNALKNIEQRCNGMAYTIECSIKDIYQSANHRMLVSLIERRVHDDRFIRLVWKFLKAGYMDERTVANTNPYLYGFVHFLLNLPFNSKPTLCGETKDFKRDAPEASPFGFAEGKERNLFGFKSGFSMLHRSVISPMLVNVYLHELDNFLEEKKKAIIYQNRNKPFLKIEKAQNLHMSLYREPKEDIFFSRYADKLIVFVAGPCGLATSLKEEIRVFLESLGLTLNFDKTKITDIRQKRVFFLGHRIGIDTSSTSVGVKYPISSVKSIISKDCASLDTNHMGLKKIPSECIFDAKNRNESLPIKRIIAGPVAIDAPIEEIVQMLAFKGFCDSKGYPTAKKLWIVQEDEQIVQNFNNIIKSIFSFYSGAKRRRYLHRIWYILKFSCAYTLANRHRKSLRKIFIKHGQKLMVKYGLKGEKSVSLEKPSFKEGSRRWESF